MKRFFHLFAFAMLIMTLNSCNNSASIADNPFFEPVWDTPYGAPPFERIKFVGSEIAESSEWYTKKMLRDRSARREYFSVERNRRQHGDLYITQIMDEEMIPNDPRLR